MRISDDRPAQTRRGALAGLASLAGVAGLAGLGGAAMSRPALADALTDAQGVVGALSGELTRLVASGRSGAQLSSEFQRILVSYADVPAIAAASLGPAWRGASAAQKQGYVAAFQSYLAGKYGRQFNSYKNARITVIGARDAGNAGVLVNTAVVRPGSETIAVDWQISARSGRPRVVNLIIEGVSLLANERAEIGAMLDAQGAGIDGLIAELRGRA